MADKISRSEVYTNQYIAGLVKRYHTWPMLREQSVGEHCWRVCTLYIEIFGPPRPEVFVFMLHHDSGEQWAGDVPFGTKHGTPGLKEAMNRAEENGRSKLGIKLPDLEIIEYTKVKICDLLEMWETGVHERNLGNRYADPIIEDTWNQAVDLANHNDLGKELHTWYWSKSHDR